MNNKITISIKNILIASTLACALLASGCARQTFMVSKQHKKVNLASDKRQHFYVYGVGQQKTTDAQTICKKHHQKVYQVETQLTAGDILLGMVTFGIYTPHTARVTCTA